jgi:hypothetical protein
MRQITKTDIEVYCGGFNGDVFLDMINDLFIGHDLKSITEWYL